MQSTTSGLRDARHGETDHQQGNQAGGNFVFNHREYPGEFRFMSLLRERSLVPHGSLMKVVIEAIACGRKTNLVRDQGGKILYS